MTTVGFGVGIDAATDGEDASGANCEAVTMDLGKDSAKVPLHANDPNAACEDSITGGKDGGKGNDSAVDGKEGGVVVESTDCEAALTLGWMGTEADFEDSTPDGQSSAVAVIVASTIFEGSATGGEEDGECDFGA